MNENLTRFVEVGIAAARAAGEEALEVQRAAAFNHAWKADKTLATEGDLRAEKKIVEVLSVAFPTHRLLGEEGGARNEDTDSPYRWLFDPIDGTWSFVNQELTAVVNIALLRGEEVIVGIIHNPLTGETFVTAKGQPTTLNDIALTVTHWTALREGVLNYQMDAPCRADIDGILTMWGEGHIGKLVSMGGAPSYALATCAKGAHSIFVMGPKGRKTDLWDIASGVLMVRNAGGRVTDLDGRDADPLCPPPYLVAASDPQVHEEALALLRQYGVGSR
jgi:myo-inositol-1(or 4)-monophosphatase